MKKNIRLAVIGRTSSGKTYLLRDMIESFAKMGFNNRDSLGKLYSSPAHFCAKCDGKGGSVEKTAVVQCRTYDEYRGDFFRPGGTANSFKMGFLDIPGDIFTTAKIASFHSLLNELYKLRGVFEVTVFSNGGVESKLLKFVGQSSATADNDDTYEKIVRAYEQQGYKESRLRNLIKRKITGKHLVTHFFDYDTDSVVAAVTKAIDLFSPQFKSDSKNFEKTGEAKNMFYFFYAIYATDVILCDKFTLPEIAITDKSKENNAEAKEVEVKEETTKEADTGSKDGSRAENQKSAANDYPISSLVQLYAIKQFSRKKRNYYLAFRGADAFLSNVLDDLYSKGMNIDQVYALIVYLLEYHLTGDNIIKDDLSELLSRDVANYLTSSDIKEAADDKPEKKEIRGNDLKKYADKYFKSDYHILDYYGQDPAARYINQNDILRYRIDLAVRDFLRLQGLPEKVRERQFLPRHVFITTSAIDNEAYEVYGNDPLDITKMQGPVALASNRACFGTYQLCESLLKQYNIQIDPQISNGSIGLIDRYIN